MLAVVVVLVMLVLLTAEILAKVLVVDRMILY